MVKRGLLFSGALFAGLGCAYLASAGPYTNGATVVFFGDSITHGGNYPAYVTAYYRTRFPDRKIRFVNSGIGGDTAAGALRRIPEDVTEYAPAHVTFHFGMNDVGRDLYNGNGDEQSVRARERAQEDYRKNLPALVSAVRRKNPNAAFTYLTPTPYDEEMTATNAPPAQKGCKAGLARLADFVRAQAKRDGVSVVDWFTPLDGFLARHRKSDPAFRLTGPDRVHPGKLGHSLMAWKFLEEQGVPALVSDTTVDAQTGTATAENATVTDVVKVQSGVSFILKENSLPLPVAAEALPHVDECRIAEKHNRERLRVKGLSSDGLYDVTIDDQRIGTWTGAELAGGIELGFNVYTPQYRQAQAVLRQIERLNDREVRFRDHLSARWYFGSCGAPVDDVAAFADWMKSYKGDDWSWYFSRFVPGYLEFWPEHRTERERLWTDQQRVNDLARPKLHRYVVRQIQTGARLVAELDRCENGFYRRNEKIRIDLTATGLTPDSVLPATMRTVDECDREHARQTFEIKTDARGFWRGHLSLDADTYGFRRVLITTEQGLTLPKAGSRPAGSLTYAVCHAPDERKPLRYDDCFFGLFGDKNNLSRWIGCHLIYGSQRPSPDPNATGWMSEADGWEQWGTLIPANTAYLNAFASPEARKLLKSAGENRREVFELMADSEGRRHLLETYAAYVRAAKTQFAGRPRVYECLLEPDINVDRPARIVEAAEAIYKTVKSVDPEGVVALPDLSTVADVDYHRKLFDLGLARSLDAFAVHPYCAYPPEPSGFISRLRETDAIVDKAAGRALPKFATEAGFATPATQDGELLQMEGLVRKQLILLGEGYRFSYVFYPHDYGNDSGEEHDGDFGICYNLSLAPFGLSTPEQRWGNVRLAPRPAAPALSAACWHLDGKRPTACLDCLDEGVWGYAYADATDDVVIAVWDYSGKNAEIDLPVGRKEIRVSDCMGNERAETCAKGVLHLRLSTAPAYVLAPDPSLWGRKAKRPADLFRPKRKMNAAAPVSIDAICPVARKGGFGIVVTLASHTNVLQRLTLSTRIRGIPEARHPVSLTLAADERCERTVFLKDLQVDPFAFHTVEVTAETADGSRQTCVRKFNFLSADYVPDSGSTDVFAAGRTPHFLSPTNGVRMAFGWNERHLLVEAQVDETAFVNDRTGFLTWDGDALQLALAGCVLERGTSNCLRDLRTEAYTENTLALTHDGASVYRTITFDSERFPGGVQGGGEISADDVPRTIDVVTNQTGGVTIRYRAAFPWRMLGRETARAGESAFFAASVNNRDPGSGRRDQRHVFAFKAAAPKGFGRIVLASPADASGERKKDEARWVARFAGELGQSGDADGKPLPWNDVAWCADDGCGNVYLPGGWMIPNGDEKPRRDSSLPDGRMIGNGRTLYLWCRSASEMKLTELTRKIGSWVETPVSWRWTDWNWIPAVAPAGVRTGVAARYRVVALDAAGRRVVGWKMPGGEYETALDFSGESWAGDVCGVAFEPGSGDLLLSTKWNTRKVFRFDASGLEVRKSGFWPCPVFGLSLQPAQECVWAVVGGASKVGTDAVSRVRDTLGFHAYETRGIAWSGKGHYLATSQGVHYYPVVSPRHGTRRIGGLPGITAIALSNGRVVAAEGFKMHILWLDDRADEPFESDMHDLVGNRWGGRVDAIDVADGRFYLQEGERGETWCFDPSVTQGAFREKRMFKVSRPVVARSKEAVLPGIGRAVAKAEHIEICNGRGERILTIPASAACMASEGPWLLAYVPSRAAILKWKIENEREGVPPIRQAGMPRLADVRLEGSVSRKMNALFGERIFGANAQGGIYEEAVNAFRTHYDDRHEMLGWSGSGFPEGFWQGEYWGKTMLSAAAVCDMTQDRDLRNGLKERALAFVREFQKPDGYLSSYADADFLGGRMTNGVEVFSWNVWSQKYTMWALLELSRVTDSPELLQAARKMADNLISRLDRLGLGIDDTGYFAGLPSMSILKPMTVLYRRTGEAKYLEFCRELVSKMERADGRAPNLMANAFGDKPIHEWYPNPDRWAKAYEMLSCLEGMIAYSVLAQDSHVLEAVRRDVSKIERHELNAVGGVGFFDHFTHASVCPNATTEPCDVTHWIRVNRELFRVTDDVRCLDNMEFAFYNAFLAGVYRDGKWGAHAVRSHGTRHRTAPHQVGMKYHQCCIDNMPRTFADFASTLVSRTPDGTLSVNLFSPGRAKLDGDEVEISGDYPVANQIRVTVKKATAGRVRFRRPKWFDDVLVDGVCQKGAWHQVQVEAGARTFEIAFVRKPRWMAPTAVAGEDPRAWNFERTEENPEMAGMARREPAMRLAYGPLLLAKSMKLGSTKSDVMAARSLSDPLRTCDIEPSASDQTWGAWRVTFKTTSGSVVSVPVCDFSSAADADDPSNAFSVWF